VFVVPGITNPVFGTTMLVSVEASPLDPRSDVAQLVRDHAIDDPRSARSCREVRFQLTISRRDRHRPFFRNEQVGFVPGHVEHISDVMSREVHAVDVVRQPARQPNPHARPMKTRRHRARPTEEVYAILTTKNPLCSEKAVPASQIPANDDSTIG
jgi:hypothetical protein